MLKLASIFAAVFLAELGDKTQLATLLFASDRSLNPLLVFAAASAALVASTAIAVLLGSLASRYFAMLPLKPIAGVGFVGIGSWMLIEHFRAAVLS
ncbi:MAG: TMEM165/GDT1 family protein [Alphaproteobacteria bacterium]